MIHPELLIQHTGNRILTHFWACNSPASWEHNIHDNSLIQADFNQTDCYNSYHFRICLFRSHPPARTECFYHVRHERERLANILIDQHQKQKMQTRDLTPANSIHHLVIRRRYCSPANPEVGPVAFPISARQARSDVIQLFPSNCRF